MSWWYAFLGDDQAPMFTNSEKTFTDCPAAGLKINGPYISLPAAIAAADIGLRHDVNMLRRSLSALRRGEYFVMEKETTQ